MGVKHLAILVNTEKQQYDEVFQAIKNILKVQVKKDIRIMTIGLPVLPDEALREFFKFYLKKDYFDNEKIKVSIIGKWYDLSADAIEELKKIIDETKDYDSYFLNFTINYDGQEEIVDACKLMCRQVVAGKLNLEKIGKMSIKDNLYSSYFVPPELIISTGKENRLSGFLLWDSVDSQIMFTGSDFSELGESQLLEMLKVF
ncbi:undecaprenyl diphosphate synthase family protein [Candidatus Woesearchaeota archaeon]|nr:undecaprenyl diphosphate synthase family protein [Candidatus Woesearchaeota archaeon]MBW3017392.1 undecaprenyl diphosphate synthase family protein [Candidatus Woesearchaeota archaeon]